MSNKAARHLRQLSKGCVGERRAIQKHNIQCTKSWPHLEQAHGNPQWCSHSNPRLCHHNQTFADAVLGTTGGNRQHAQRYHVLASTPKSCGNFTFIATVTNYTVQCTHIRETSAPLLTRAPTDMLLPHWYSTRAPSYPRGL